ncbi:hypothetical protein Hdeb2414_s0016g00481371 [Helianthus debilis subsp. tardiflorus]
MNLTRSELSNRPEIFYVQSYEKSEPSEKKKFMDPPLGIGTYKIEYQYWYQCCSLILV